MNVHTYRSNLVKGPTFAKGLLSLTIFPMGIAAVVLVGLVCGSLAQTITTFDAPNSILTVPQGINSAGQITGYYEDSSPPYDTHAFLRDKHGSLVTFDASIGSTDPDYSACGSHPWTTNDTEATAINRAGEIAGFFRANAFVCTAERGFLRHKDGTITVFDVTVAGVSAEDQHVTAISPNGRIAGWFQYSELGNPPQGFLRETDGTIVTFDAIPAAHTETTPTGINDDEVTGYFEGPGGSGGFLRRRNGVITTFNLQPQGLNSAGQITGTAVDASGHLRGFLREHNGAVILFHVPNSTDTFPVAINSAGEITGSSVDASGHYHGFLRDKHGNITTFDVPNSTHTNPTAVNSFGDVTGWYADTGGVVHGFVRTEKEKCSGGGRDDGERCRK